MASLNETTWLRCKARQANMKLKHDHTLEDSTWLWKIFISCFRQTTKNYNLGYTTEYECTCMCCCRARQVWIRTKRKTRKTTQFGSAIFATKLGCAFINMLLKSSPFVWGEYPLAARAFQYYRAIYDVTIGLTPMTKPARVPATRLPATVKRLKNIRAFHINMAVKRYVIVDDFN